MADLLKFVTDGHVGSAASVIGLLITIVGFIATLINVRRTRKAAEQAQAAADGVRRQLTRFDAVADVTAAIGVMEEVKRLQRQLAWTVLPDRYAALRKHLISIKTSFGELTETQKTTLQNAIQHFSSIEDHIERLADEDQTQKTAARLNRTVSAQIDALQEVLLQIRQVR